MLKHQVQVDSLHISPLSFFMQPLSRETESSNILPGSAKGLCEGESTRSMDTSSWPRTCGSPPTALTAGSLSGKRSLTSLLRDPPQKEKTVSYLQHEWRATLWCKLLSFFFYGRGTWFRVISEYPSVILYSVGVFCVCV